MAETIIVQIHGSEYRLRGEDAERVRSAAEMINEQMRDIASKAPAQPAATLAVLAALNTAERLMDERERSGDMSSEFTSAMDEMTLSIRALLEEES
jgi:cell division protein ZapA (FtsZ GTPase activity inhibitor)